jgi:predicted MPP superfamily phosphohydrolase
MSYAVSIVHLSDLHFGEGSRFKDRDSGELGEQLKDTLTAAMKARFGSERPDIIIATGDLTQRASEDEFNQARLFFESLQSALGVPRSQFVFLPGNHDVSWEACKKYFDGNEDKRDLKYDSALEIKKLEQFNVFATKFYGADLPQVENLAHGAVLYTYAESGLCIVALNSCEQETDKKHLGVVSKEQAKPVMKSLRDRTELKDYVKILALHHPVNALSDKASAYFNAMVSGIESREEPSSAGDRVLQFMKKLTGWKNDKTVTLDQMRRFQADALSVDGNHLINAIMEDCQIHLLLHGHQHSFDAPHPHKWRSTAEGHCQICPAGCFGIKTDGLLEDQPSCLNVIHIGEKNARLEMNKIFLEYDPVERLPWSLDPGCFRDTNREPATAVFPISDRLRYWSPPIGVEARSASTSEHVPEQIAMILDSAAGFREVWVKLLKVTDDIKKIASKLIETRLEKVWGIAVRNLRGFNGYRTELRDLLFWLAEAEIKPGEVERVRAAIESETGIVVIPLQTRHALIAEMVLKVALKTEIEIQMIHQGGHYNIQPRNMIQAPSSLESGIEVANQREDLMDILRAKFGFENLKGEELENCIVGRLRAAVSSFSPYFLIQRGKNAIKLPYLCEFILPAFDSTVPQNNVTDMGEETLYGLIENILKRLENF